MKKLQMKINVDISILFVGIH